MDHPSLKSYGVRAEPRLPGYSRKHCSSTTPPHKIWYVHVRTRQCKYSHTWCRWVSPRNQAKHFENAVLSSSRLRFLPMNTILQIFSSPAVQGFWEVPLKIMWMAWNTYLSGASLTASTPLQRKISL